MRGKRGIGKMLDIEGEMDLRDMRTRVTGYGIGKTAVCKDTFERFDFSLRSSFFLVGRRKEEIYLGSFCVCEFS